MDKIKILATGLSGMVGSRVLELLKEKYEFEEISRNTGIDITDRDKVWEKIKNTDAQIILHLAAYTNVDQAEIQKDLKSESEAWKINVNGTQNIAQAAQEFGKKLIYISTDMVFDGNQEATSKYFENDIASPVNFYGLTKYHAEEIVGELADFLIIRIAYPFRSNFDQKMDYVRFFKKLLSENKNISAVSDHFFTPLFIDDLAFVIDTLIEKKQIGIFHAVSDISMSPFMVALKIAEKFNLNKSLISEILREQYFKGKAIRGFNLSLNNDKIKQLGVKLNSFDEALGKINL